LLSWTDSKNEMQVSGGHLLAAGLDGGNTLQFALRQIGNESVRGHKNTDPNGIAWNAIPFGVD